MMESFQNYSLLPDILLADASVNPENDLKYGAQNFGENTNGYHYIVCQHHKQHFKESLSKHFFCFEQIPIHWQATNVRFPPLQDPLQKARLPTISLKMVGVLPEEKCSPPYGLV